MAPPINSDGVHLSHHSDLSERFDLHTKFCFLNQIFGVYFGLLLERIPTTAKNNNDMPTCIKKYEPQNNSEKTCKMLSDQLTLCYESRKTSCSL